MIEGPFEDPIPSQEFCIEDIKIETASEEPGYFDTSTQVIMYCYFIVDNKHECSPLYRLFLQFYFLSTLFEVIFFGMAAMPFLCRGY